MQTFKNASFYKLGSSYIFGVLTIAILSTQLSLITVLGLPQAFLMSIGAGLLLAVSPHVLAPVLIANFVLKREANLLRRRLIYFGSVLFIFMEVYFYIYGSFSSGRTGYLVGICVSFWCISVQFAWVAPPQWRKEEFKIILFSTLSALIVFEASRYLLGGLDKVTDLVPLVFFTPISVFIVVRNSLRLKKVWVKTLSIAFAAMSILLELWAGSLSIFSAFSWQANQNSNLSDFPSPGALAQSALASFLVFVICYESLNLQKSRRARFAKRALVG